MSDVEVPNESAIPADENDDTTVGAASDETTTIPADDAVTQLRQLAWSAEEAETDDFTEHEPTQTSWYNSPRAFWMLAAAAAVLAVVVLAVSRPAPSTTATAPAAPSVPGTVTVVQPARPTVTVKPPAPTAPSAETQDATYYALTRLDGYYNSAMKLGGAAYARAHCVRLEGELESGHPLTADTHAAVYNWVDVYCPQYDPRGSVAVAANLARATTESTAVIPSDEDQFQRGIGEAPPIDRMPSTADALAEGREACTLLAGGRTEIQAADVLAAEHFSAYDYGVAFASADWLVGAARDNLCGH
jgi:hypothetical protein